MKKQGTGRAKTALDPRPRPPAVAGIAAMWKRVFGPRVIAPSLLGGTLALATSLSSAPSLAQSAPAQPSPAAPPTGEAAPAKPALPPPAAPKPGAWKWTPKPPKDPPPPPPPNAPVRLTLIALGPDSSWSVRINNDGDHPIRVPADIRLLTIEVETGEGKAKKVQKCTLPTSMLPSGFPESRGLLLGPGDSYTEAFDPKLFCFGKLAALLKGGAIVRARLGWPDPPKWVKKATGPFVAESADKPAAYSPVRGVVSPTILLSHREFSEEPSDFPAPAPKAPAEEKPAAGDKPATGDKPASDNKPATGDKPASDNKPATGDKPASDNKPATGDKPAAADKPAAGDKPATGDKPAAADKPAPLVDANAPRLIVEGDKFADAATPRSASVSVSVKNAGGRPLVAVFRSRMIGFEVRGPDRAVSCPASPPTQAVPRDMYREHKPDQKTSFQVLLQEACPAGVFSRPGLYWVHVSFSANEQGQEVGIDAFTADVDAQAPILLRLQTGREPFYPDPPKAKKPKKPAEDSASKEQAPSAPATEQAPSAPAAQQAPSNASKDGEPQR